MRRPRGKLGLLPADIGPLQRGCLQPTWLIPNVGHDGITRLNGGNRGRGMRIVQDPRLLRHDVPILGDDDPDVARALYIYPAPIVVTGGGQRCPRRVSILERIGMILSLAQRAEVGEQQIVCVCVFGDGLE